jgi:hypothetical protein
MEHLYGSSREGDLEGGLFDWGLGKIHKRRLWKCNTSLYIWTV